MKHTLLLFFFLIMAAATMAQSASKADLSIYPNPITEYISVNDNNEVVGFLGVYNLIGRKLKEFEFVKGELYSIADLPKGMYLVQILDRGRRVLTTQKVDKR